MSILNAEEKTQAVASLKALSLRSDTNHPGDSLTNMGTALTHLMGHGGIYTLLDTQTMAARISALLPDNHHSVASNAAHVETLVAVIQDKVTSFFTHLKNEPYPIPSDLMSYIAFPGNGKTFTEPSSPGGDSELPAAFTFFGQFLDHDLTMNAVNLFDSQSGSVIDDASPFIDLDNVYGPRVAGRVLPDGTPPPGLFDSEGRFLIVRRNANGKSVIDLPRQIDGANQGKPRIADKRDDENQLVLQIHLLFIKLHNILLSSPYNLSFLEAYQQVVFTAQAITLRDYLPRILGKQAGDAVIDRIITHTKAIAKAASEGIWNVKTVRDALAYLRYVPYYLPSKGTLSLAMPHEFAIGFRFGHSQFRDSYQLNPDQPPVTTFQNGIQGGHRLQSEDLRGGKPLLPKHAINWEFFFSEVKSKLIDTKIASVAFNLPESAIPDDLKTLGNLVHRNLIRSRQVGVCSGEVLCDFYGIREPDKLSPKEVDSETPMIFEQIARSDGGSKFQTPLWYYILREAELRGNGRRLGPLGSRLIGEVIIGAVFYTPPKRMPDGTELNLVVPDEWTSPHENIGDLTSLAALTKFVSENEKTLEPNSEDDRTSPKEGGSVVGDFDVLMSNVWSKSDCRNPDVPIQRQPDDTRRIVVQGNILTITRLNDDGDPIGRIYARRLRGSDDEETFSILPNLPEGVEDPIVFRANGTAVVFRENGLRRLKVVGTDTNSGKCGGWIFDATEINRAEPCP